MAVTQWCMGQPRVQQHGQHHNTHRNRAGNADGYHAVCSTHHAHLSAVSEVKSVTCNGMLANDRSVALSLELE